MKTLDEVIAYFDNQTQQRHVYLTEDAEDIYNDALHYLKEYRDHVHYVEVEQEDFERLYAQLNKAMDTNPPLTWDELQEMVGKPVWVEEKPDNEWIGYWNVVKRLETFDDGSESILFISSEYYDEENYGIEWQSYLKERK